jgi:SAM-dependent methyltransferase
MDFETIAVYERGAERWAERRGDPGDDVASHLRQQLPAGLILDAGCGAGRYLDQLGSPVVGTDATAAMLVIARGCNKPLVRGDLEALPFATATFAGVFARHSYLHIPKHRLGGALTEAARVLKPDGLLLVSMIEGDYEGRALARDDFPGRWFSLWTEPEVTPLLRTAGLDPRSVERRRHGHGAADLVITCARV